MASSVLTVAARGLSRELAASSHPGCLALITEPRAPATARGGEPGQELAPAMTAGTAT